MESGNTARGIKSNEISCRRWRTCAEFTNENFGHAIGYEYVKLYFNAEKHKQVRTDSNEFKIFIGKRSRPICNLRFKKGWILQLQDPSLVAKPSEVIEKRGYRNLIKVT